MDYGSKEMDVSAERGTYPEDIEKNMIPEIPVPFISSDFAFIIVILFMLSGITAFISMVAERSIFRKRCTYRVQGRFVGYRTKKVRRFSPKVRTAHYPEYLVIVNGRKEIRSTDREYQPGLSEPEEYTDLLLNPYGYETMEASELESSFPVRRRIILVPILIILVILLFASYIFMIMSFIR